MAKSRLEQILDLVQPRIVELFPNATFAFGETNVALNAAPPRVVWFRAEQGSSAASARTTAREQVALLDRSAAVEAVCWAARGGSYTTDDAALEALVDAVEVALREQLGTALVLPLSELWTTEGWTQAGKSARLVFAVRMPVLLPAPQVLATESAPIDVGFDNDSSADPDGALDAKDT
jgi:hypothetical protein